MKGKRAEENNENSKLAIVLFGILVIIIIAIVIGIFNEQEDSKYNYSSNYTKTEINENINMDNNTRTDTENISHYCDASGCTKKGTYSINGTSGKEYYCYEHYKQMEQWAEMLMGY